MLFNVDAACDQIIGKRETQQDSLEVFQIDDSNWLSVLADGMGGHKGGREASKIAVGVFHRAFIESEIANIKERFIDCLQQVNDAIYDYVEENPDMDGMGTTFVAMLTDGERIQWISVGDSPMWLIENDSIERINENHSMAAVLQKQVEKGEITEEEARFSPQRSQLLEAVMGDDIQMVDAPDNPLGITSNSTVLIASDGVETCREEELLEMANDNDGNAKALTFQILERVEQHERPGQDNASVIAISFLDGDTELDDQAEVEDVATASGKK
ncbi:MAG: serine/threonine-protein phosphatase [Gammaproteobacteria bacterium]|nr:serine/threonine-protein phosphatase [Gammaproteobacteria bacterium]